MFNYFKGYKDYYYHSQINIDVNFLAILMNCCFWCTACMLSHIVLSGPIQVNVDLANLHANVIYHLDSWVNINCTNDFLYMPALSGILPN